jgi:hypothetical protein
MKSTIRCGIVLVATLMPVAAVAQPAAAPPPITAVLATLTVKPGVDRTALLNTMPQEVSDTVKLYLDGKIQQWFGRGDGRGVVVHHEREVSRRGQDHHRCAAAD